MNVMLWSTIVIQEQWCSRKCSVVGVLIELNYVGTYYFLHQEVRVIVNGSRYRAEQL
jgi:hypothetical protein